jgi:hypothetical protein
VELLLEVLRLVDLVKVGGEVQEGEEVNRKYTAIFAIFSSF